MKTTSTVSAPERDHGLGGGLHGLRGGGALPGPVAPDGGDDDGGVAHQDRHAGGQGSMVPPLNGTHEYPSRRSPRKTSNPG